MKARTKLEGWPDIHPRSSEQGWERPKTEDSDTFSIEEVAPVVGLQPSFVRRVIAPAKTIGFRDIERLLLIDDAAETFVPRSRVAAYFQRMASRKAIDQLRPHSLALNQVICGDAHKLIPTLGDESIDCVVTSTPYWAVRIYGTPKLVEWADGEICP